MKEKNCEFGYEKCFETFAKKLNNYISKNNNICKFFIDQVDEEKDGAEEYYIKISVPSYLNLIIKRLEKSYYKTFESLIFDFELIKKNSLIYNGKENSLTKFSEKLFDAIMKIIKETLESSQFNEEFIEKIINLNCYKNKWEYQTNAFNLNQSLLLDKEKNDNNFSSKKRTRRNKNEVDYSEDSPKGNGNEFNHIEIHEEVNCNESEESININENLMRMTRGNKNRTFKNSDIVIKNNSKTQEKKSDESTRSLRTRKNVKFNFDMEDDDYNNKTISDDSDKNALSKKNLRIKRSEKDSLVANRSENDFNGRMLGRKRNKHIIKFEI